MAFDKSVYEGVFTVYDSGSDDWAVWFPFGSKIEIKRVNGKIQFNPVRGVCEDIESADADFEELDPNDKSKIALRVHCPKIHRYLFLQVEKVGNAKKLSMGDTTHFDDDHDHDHKSLEAVRVGPRVLRIKHGGPHGVD